IEKQSTSQSSQLLEQLYDVESNSYFWDKFVVHVPGIGGRAKRAAVDRPEENHDIEVDDEPAVGIVRSLTAPWNVFEEQRTNGQAEWLKVRPRKIIESRSIVFFNDAATTE